MFSIYGTQRQFLKCDILKSFKCTRNCMLVLLLTLVSWQLKNTQHIKDAVLFCFWFPVINRTGTHKFIGSPGVLLWIPIEINLAIFFRLLCFWYVLTFILLLFSFCQICNAYLWKGLFFHNLQQNNKLFLILCWPANCMLAQWLIQANWMQISMVLFQFWQLNLTNQWKFITEWRWCAFVVHLQTHITVITLGIFIVVATW